MAFSLAFLVLIGAAVLGIGIILAIFISRR